MPEKKKSTTAQKNTKTFSLLGSLGLLTCKSSPIKTIISAHGISLASVIKKITTYQWNNNSVRIFFF